MGKRRWRFVAIAAILLFYVKDAKCQDNFYFPQPVERNFAQVQPPLFNNRPSSVFDHTDYRVAPTIQQPLQFSDGRVRFPSPNYNQNPSPFQLPTRSQNNPQYFANQADFIPTQRQRIRPPFNYEFPHPASSVRPDTSQIHSVAYQNDPSKPEAFLGQVTLNNPDIDYLQQNRFKNIPFDGNSLKSNGQSGHISHDEIDNDDIYDPPKVTTYNPNKSRQRLNTREEIKYPLPSSESEIPDKYPIKYLRQRTRPKTDITFTNQNNEASTEYKELLGLLEADVSDISKFTELMKNPKTSFDVEVINSNNSYDTLLDSKPSASSMNADNAKNSQSYNALKNNKQRHFAPTTSTTTSTTTTTTTSTTTTTEAPLEDEHEDTHSHEEHDKNHSEEEYVEYYDENESEETTTIKHFNKSVDDSDIYDDYDATDEPENETESDARVHTEAPKTINTESSHVLSELSKPNTTQYDILIMKPNKTLVKDDNFHDFVDTSEIDQTTEQLINNESSEISTSSPVSYEEYSSVETPAILGQEVVSVVTTKSVVNGTISVPDVTFSPSTVKIKSKVEDLMADNDNDNDTSIPVTTENWVVVASVQTSRSVSGARFLPFPGVEQEERKQVLTDDKEEDFEQVTSDPIVDSDSNSNSSSTENINDKLDSIQSELSSAVLSGDLSNENKNIELITETTTENSVSNVTTIPTTTGPLNVFTLKMIQSTSEPEKSPPEPLPVLIKKFTHRVTTTSTSTTPKPKKKLVTVMDDLSGLLPPGYKPRHSYKDKRTSTTSTTTTTTTTPIPSTVSTTPIANGTQGRSSGINSKNRVIVLDDKSLLPKEYKPKEIKVKEDIFKNVDEDAISKLLPPGYKPPASDESGEEKPEKSSILDKLPIQKVDITSFLPKGFKLNSSSEETELKAPVKVPKPVSIDFASLLPKGFKLNSSESSSKELDSSPIDVIKVADISNLLPPGFKINETEDSSPSLDNASTTKAPGSFKVVFPSRPGGKTTRKPIYKASSSGPPLSTPKIQKGWPTRASTEFTGWPTVSTTPFSFDKLLETIKSTSPDPRDDLPEVVTRRSTTTTTTTTMKPPPPTTPGICQHDCDIAATIKLVSGAKWVPELLDHHTEEWQRLAKELKQELNSVYSKSDLLKKWYKGVRIDSFSEGSVLVDYIIELNDVEERVDTQTLKKMFHKSLIEAKPGSVVQNKPEDKGIEFNPDVMQGDQPEEDRSSKSNEKMTKTIDKSAGKLEIGKFVMDPAYTDFIVLPRREGPKIVEPEEESFLPQWGIAVIVIALASLLFVVIFGVTVLVNRQKSAKAKQPIPLSEDMFRDLDKNHMGGFDDLHLNEREHPYSSGKSVSTAAFIEQLAYSNPGDSWRSEWTPQMQKYMQHYTPDSGRGSQIYGHTGNQYGPSRQVSFRRSLRGESRKYRNRHRSSGYGGGGSQVYGHLGGGSQGYGYTGEYGRGQYPTRRRSDYDTNF